MTAEQSVGNDNRILELLELLTKNQMNAQAEQVKQMCGYVETLEQQIFSLTEEVKSVRQQLASMKEDSISKHVKDNLQKTADTLQVQCVFIKQQVRDLKEKVCKRAGKIADAAKRKGQRALYKITKITGMRGKLDAVKAKVDRAIEKVENLEKAMGECCEQQKKSVPAETLLPDYSKVEESQIVYGAELFEQYQKEHGAELAGGCMIIQEAEKSR